MSKRAKPTEIGGYPSSESRDWEDLLDWHGKPTGIRVRVVSSYATPRSHMGSRMYSYEGKDGEGRLYYGRGFGKSMSLGLRLKKSKTRSSR